jgi:hypothetical protein
MEQHNEMSDVVDEAQWEHCALWCATAKETWGGTKFDVSIIYYGRTTENTAYLRRTIAETGRKDRTWAYHPFHHALGQLGLAGWELVSVQHADSAHAPTLTELQQPGGLRDSEVVAYLRRRARQGRHVDEPDLDMP